MMDSFISCWKSKKDVCRPFTSEGFAYQHSILRCFCGFNRNFVAFFMIRGFQFPVFEIEVWGACMHTNACASDRNVEKGMACSISIWCGFYKIGFQTDFKNPRFYKLVTHWTSVTSSREQQRTPVYCLFSFQQWKNPWHLLAKSKRNCLFSFQQWKNIRDIFSRTANEPVCIFYFLSNNERKSGNSSATRTMENQSQHMDLDQTLLDDMRTLDCEVLQETLKASSRQYRFTVMWRK